MQPALSVITCAHNPRRNYLEKVLNALKAQTLSTENWEFLLVDNASDRPLATEIDLSWHPQARHIREDQLGLTPARLRGIQDSVGDTLVFVDDDNVLDSDYLEIAFRIHKDWSVLGAWGGQIKPDFEIPPPDWAKPYLKFLAIREFDRDQWSNLLHQHETTPCGAGLCVRRSVAERYADIVRHDPKRASLDRKGNLLTSCGDSDLAFTACDLGLGTGQFTALKMTHMMPAARLQEEYLLRLVEGMAYSGTILDSFRGKLPSPLSWRTKVLQRYQYWKLDSRSRRFYDVSQRGLALALKEIAERDVEEQQSWMESPGSAAHP